jgi:hypothetical protein
MNIHSILRKLTCISLLFLHLHLKAQNFPNNSIVYDTLGNALYMSNQIIIKFNPRIVDTSVVNDTSFNAGIVSDFIHPFALQMIIDSGYFNEDIANLGVERIHRFMTTYDTLSITRTGDTIRVPEFWSVFLVEWSDYEGMSMEEAIDTLNTMWPLIEYAHPNYIIGTLADPLRTNNYQGGIVYNSSFPNAHIGVEGAWARCNKCDGTSNIRVGIFDSGTNWDHKDFSADGSGSWSQSRIKGGYDYINKKLPNWTTSLDDLGHGTPVASIIGAIKDNNEGLAGIAGGSLGDHLGVSLFDYKFINSNNIGTVANAAAAIRLGAQGLNSNGHGLHVMNHSWSFLSLVGKDYNVLEEVIIFAFNNKVINVCASGNSGGNDKQYPASFKDEWVIKVGGSGTDGLYHSDATYGNSIDCIAPSQPQLNAFCNHSDETTYRNDFAGTSASTPHVAGVASIMLSYIYEPTTNAPNGLAPEDVEYLIQQGCSDPNNLDEYSGYGRVNADNTFAKMMLPYIEVRHYTSEFNSGVATKIGSNVSITVTKGENGIPPGTYIGDVFEVVRTFDISQQEFGRIITDVWKLNSSSNLYANQPVISEVNPELIWEINNQTTASMKGYFFYIKYRTQGLVNIPYYRYIPANVLKEKGRMSLSVYSYDANPTSISSPSINNVVSIGPNPSNGTINIHSSVVFSNAKIEIIDVSGYIVYSSITDLEGSDHTPLELNLNFLNSGFYICNIYAGNNLITKKLSIIK